ncbi:hypothetical protein jhhlp_005414 [Lomentospora prolificans]|uniref:ATP-grasp domain-containing protein n=1 Tax=Lomentospora prolificans TaxID=41688 RepID=A0A2N3N6T0_9PEZI|nr:hypothetical protein jhhlp_005414 [Lomentospora prolificans]
MAEPKPMYAFIQSAAPWLNPHIKSYIKRHVREVIFVDEFEDIPANPKRVFQFCDGWELTRNFALGNNAEASLINAYPNSDALARKDLLASVAEYWGAKRPESNLKNHVPLTVRLRLDYAEYVEDALMEADNLELLYSLEENSEKDASEREWWILKPALIDCGAGIRLFSTVDELAGHLELAEYEYDDDEESDESEASVKIEKVEEGDNGPYMTAVQADQVNLDFLVNATGTLSMDDSSKTSRKSRRPQYVFKENGRIPSAQMRAFVAQRYIAAVPTIDSRKWHARAYVLCVGRLKVYVFKELLALLAGENYQPPWENPSLKASLTNTGLQEEEDFIKKESMRDYWKVSDDLLPGEWKKRAFEQMCSISSEIVRAAAYTMADKFTVLNKNFELFAADFLLDTTGNVWLLEMNETPAFYQHGVAGPIAKRLMESVITIALEHMGAPLSQDVDNEAVKDRFVLAVDESETMAKSNIRQIVSEDDAATSLR